MQANPLSWDYLTELPPVENPLGPLAIAFYTFCTVGLLVSIYFAAWGKRRHFKTKPLLERIVGTYATIGYSVFGIALIFMVLRVLEVPFLGMRLWTYIAALAILGTAAYVLYFQIVHYPRLAKEHRQQEARKRYLQPTGRPAGKGRRKRRR